MQPQNPQILNTVPKYHLNKNFHKEKRDLLVHAISLKLLLFYIFIWHKARAMKTHHS